jgi:Mut7-C ubiquitin
MTIARFQFSRDLERFLRPEHRDRPCLKDAIGALGVPHTEVGTVRVNGEPATLLIRHGARLAREESRIVLTRDRDLLKCRDVVRGYYVRSLKSEAGSPNAHSPSRAACVATCRWRRSRKPRSRAALESICGTWPPLR